MVEIGTPCIIQLITNARYYCRSFEMAMHRDFFSFQQRVNKQNNFRPTKPGSSCVPIVPKEHYALDSCESIHVL